jgi:hypothetical protein
MTHAFSGLFGGGHSPSYIPVQSAPTPQQVLQPGIAPMQGTQPGVGQTPSFLGSSVLPPQQGAGGGQSNQKRLMGQ